MRLLLPSFLGSLRWLNSGPVTAMVYGFRFYMEPLGTRGYMPFVTFGVGRSEIWGKHHDFDLI
jgi:hypothetical protein